MKKNKFTWLFASSALLALSLTTTNTVKADTTADSNTDKQESTNNNQTTEKPNSDIVLNNTDNSTTTDNSNVSDTDTQSVKDSSNSTATTDNNSSLNAGNTSTVNSTTTDATVDEDNNIITSTWGTSPVTFNTTTGVLTVNAGTLKSGGVNDNKYLDLDKKILKADILTIQFKSRVVAPVDSSGLFYRFFNLTAINGSLDTSAVTNMYAMFGFNMSIESLDLNTWDTSKVTNMAYMFYETHSLRSISIDDWNTSNVKYMNGMFYSLYSHPLVHLDLDNWNTSNVINMSYMFFFNASLKDLHIGNWDTSKVTNMSDMFRGANSLQVLDMHNWDTSKVTAMSLFVASAPVTRFVLGPKTFLNLLKNDTDNDLDLTYMMKNDIYTGYWVKIANGSIYDPVEPITRYKGLADYKGGQDTGTYVLERYALIINYVDTKGNKIIDSDIIFGKLKSNYTITYKKIDGYTFRNIEQGTESGIYTSDSNPIRVTLVYTKDTPVSGTVNVKYVDENGKNVADPDKMTGDVGEHYSTTPKTIPGYELDISQFPTNATGNYVDKPQTVTYIYKKHTDPTPEPIQTGKVTAKYVDEDGNKIADDIVFTGTVGTSYSTIQSAIDGYTFKEVSGNTSGFFTSNDQVVTYVYTKDTVPSPTPDPTPEPKPDDNKPVPNPDDNKPSPTPDNNNPIVKPDNNNNVNPSDKTENNVVNNKNKLPQTGSNNSIFTVLIGMIISLLTIIGSVFKKNNL